MVLGLVFAGCARERTGYVGRAEGKKTVNVAGAEIFVVKGEVVDELLAPAKAAAAAKKKEVEERFAPQIAKAEANLTKVMGAAQLKDGDLPPAGADVKRNAAMEALMGKQKELYLARQAVWDVGFETLRRTLTQPPVGVTRADGMFTVKLKSSEVMLVLDAKTKIAWRADASEFDGPMNLDEARRVAFP